MSESRIPWPNEVRESMHQQSFVKAINEATRLSKKPIEEETLAEAMGRMGQQSFWTDCAAMHSSAIKALHGKRPDEPL